MKRLEELLLEIKNMLELQYPHTTDSDANYVNTITATAGATTTLTLSFTAGWRIVVQLLYADAATDCTYKWYYKGKEVTGNEIPFVKPQLFTRPEEIVLRVVNSGAIDRDVDVLVKAFGREIP